MTGWTYYNKPPVTRSDDSEDLYIKIIKPTSMTHLIIQQYGHFLIVSLSYY